MSAGVMPDMYRHTARKSTVSKNVKPASLSMPNHSTTNYIPYADEKNSHEQIIFDTLECNIKLEKEIPQLDEPFLILPDNEMEEMILGEDIERTNEDVIYEIIEQIIQQIIQSSSTSISNQIARTLSANTQEAHQVVDSMMNQFNEIDGQEVSSNHMEENENTSSDEMESDQPTSAASRSQTDDDIVEIDGTSNTNSPHLCTCQCHKPNSPLNNEYLLFEEALKQTRLEQQHQQDKSFSNNRLMQMLKRQHDELMSIYQQNQKQQPSKATKIDREQQTIQLNLHDSQMQTDTTSNNNSKTSSPPKSMLTPTINSNHNGPLTSTRNHSMPSNSNQTTLLQMIPRLSANAVATTIITNKTSTVTTTKTAIVTNAPAPTATIPSSTSTSPDIVDLTEEEDEDDTASRIPTTPQTAPLRQSTSSVQSPAASTTASPTTATRVRAANRAIRPNNPLPNGQAFPLRPLLDHLPCDLTIARPQLSITQENATVRLTWNLPSTLMESIQNYEIYAYKQNATTSVSDWKKIGSVKSMRLPMAVTLKEFQSNSHYAFAVRAVSITNHIGPFCEPKTIFTGSTSVQPLHTSQLLNVSS